MEEKLEERATLGKHASLGQFYSISSDSLLDLKIFDEVSPDQLHINYVNTISYNVFNGSPLLLPPEENFLLCPEQHLNLLCGNIGESKFVQKLNKIPSNFPSLHLQVTTRKEDLDFENFSEENLLTNPIPSNATHIVVGIEWGGNLIINHELENKTEFSDDDNINSSSVIDMLCSKLQDETAENIEFSSSQFQFNLFSDIDIDNDIIILNTIDEVISHGKNFMQSVSNYSGGLEVPISVKLLPLRYLQSIGKISQEPLNNFKLLSDANTLGFIKLFQYTIEAQERFKTMIDIMDKLNLQDYQDMFRNDIVETSEQVDNFTKNIKFIIGQVKSCQLPSKVLNQPVKDLKKFFSETGRKFKEIEEKLKLISYADTMGGKFIPTNCRVEEELTRHPNSLGIILFYQKLSTCHETWKENKDLFISLLRNKQSDCKYYIIDMDIHETSGELPIQHISCIQVTFRGRILQGNLLKDLENEKNVPMAVSYTQAVEMESKSDKVTIFRKKCPSLTCQASVIHSWTCKSCLSLYYYGPDNFVYCDCGRDLRSSLLYKCTDPSHGPFFTFQESSGSMEMHPKMTETEMNILILGETGVGKSTWINCFANFLKFKSLEDAENNDLFSIIPTSFKITDEDFNDITIQTGESSNESMDDGQSSTQETKIYSFHVNNMKVQIIDTPGIGDTRGMEQDNKNFENILDTLQQLEYLHGICVLLKPNQSKVNVMFRFCIMELLTHLHQDASKNIVFCFTNSRSTFYKPGDTRRSLLTLLDTMKDVRIPFEKETVYCFDNESFRYLAAIKNNPPLTFNSEEGKNFLKSWQKSMDETERMLLHFKSLAPHPIKSTLNLNHVREMVSRLARPLAEIVRKILQNKIQVRNELKEILEMNSSFKSLQNLRIVKRAEIVTRKLDFPQTVCKLCVKSVDMGGEVHIKHKVCHKKCTTQEIKLRRCRALMFGVGICYLCRHNYKQHFHNHYDSTIIQKSVVDSTIENALRNDLDESEIRKNLIERKNLTMKEYEDEKKLILLASAKFAYFLKEKSITSQINDELESHLNRLIQEEILKVDAGKDREMLKALEEVKSLYLNEKQILKERISTQGYQITQKMVEKLLHKIKLLKNSGEDVICALACYKASEQLELGATLLEIPVERGEDGSEGGLQRFFECQAPDCEQ